MIYQDTLRFLKQHIKKISAHYEWTELDNIALLNILYKRYSHESILNSISELKAAFRDCFESVGKLIFKYDEISGIKFRILPYSIQPTQSKHLEKIIEIILSNRDQIEHPYNGKKDQIALKGKIRRKINAEISDSEEAVNKKELIKYAIKKALKLDEKDVVLLLKRKYLVRLFDKQKKAIAKETQEEVYDIEDLEEDYKDFFSEVDVRNFLDIVMDYVMTNELSFDKSDNFYYEQNAHKIIKASIARELAKYIDDSIEYRNAFSEYIFRTNFIAMHERFAIILLEEIVNKNQDAENFLKYYSGETILRHGKKYQIPSLESADGGKWNVVSVVSIASLFIKTRNKKDEYTIDLNKLMKLVSAQKDITEKVDTKFDAYCNMKNKIQDAIEVVKGQLEETRLSFQAYSKDDLDEHEKHRLLREEKEYESRVIDLQDKVVEVEKVRSTLQHELLKERELLRAHEAKLSNVKLEIRSLEQNLMVNSGSYQTILTSLTKAIMKRKMIV